MAAAGHWLGIKGMRLWVHWWVEHRRKGIGRGLRAVLDGESEKHGEAPGHNIRDPPDLRLHPLQPLQPPIHVAHP